jgi:hypothetical protein
VPQLSWSILLISSFFLAPSRSLAPTVAGWVPYLEVRARSEAKALKPEVNCEETAATELYLVKVG